MPYQRFLLTDGGPTYRLEVWAGFTHYNRSRMLHRGTLAVCITWVPLLILSALQGHAWGHSVTVPFLRDYAAHARFLLAVPLLLSADLILGPHLARAADYFASSGLLTPQDLPKFERAVADGLRWRDSWFAEFVFIVVAYLLAFIGHASLGVHVSTWAFIPSASGTFLTWAGWWSSLLCVPIFQFLSLRWMWRLFLWGQFLWRMNRLDLNLMPTHPDAAGGLGFVGEVQGYFGVILFAYSATVSGVLANSILYDKLALPHFTYAIAIYVLASIAMVLSPMFVFSDRLIETKRMGGYQYGSLANQYTSSFYRKWIIGSRDASEELLGTGDIQSLADLGNSFSFIDRMRWVPFGTQIPIYLALACVVPMLPLLLTMMPIGDLVKLAFTMLH